ncbi:MAG: hypothetical protein Q9162_003073 [Coniocarpon cinnabarinum]
MADHNPAARGALIVFEGLDKAGKSTQCAQLANSLSKQGHRVKAMRFPDRTTPIGQMIDSYLKGVTHAEDHVIHLLFSANRWEAAASIEADLVAGTTVVIDRYYYSGAVYSAAKHNPHLGLEWARKSDEGLPRPDVCLFLYISSDDAGTRGGYGEEKYEKREMQDRVRTMFAELQDSPDGEDFVAIDGDQSPREVAAEVLSEANKAINRIHNELAPLRHVGPWI